MADAVGAALGGRLWSSARRRRGDKIGFFRRGALRDVVGIAISGEGRRGVAVRSEASRLIMAAEGSRGWEEADAGGGGRPSWLAPVVEEHGFADGGSSGKATSGFPFSLCRVDVRAFVTPRFSAMKPCARPRQNCLPVPDRLLVIML